MSKLERIALLCARECLRQNVGVDRLGMLLKAYAYAQRHVERLPDTEDVSRLARLIEPRSQGTFRRVPVTFGNGESAVGASAISGAIERLFDRIAEATPEEWTKAFLDIHPFIDGNGRTAFILYNWLSRSFDDPKPLPLFYDDRWSHGGSALKP